MLKLSKKYNILWILIVGFIGVFIYKNYLKNIENSENNYGNHNYLENVKFDRFSHLIFIGGWPRSGTTLMRVILDVHEDVRCGPESRVIPKMLDMYKQIMDVKVILKRKAIEPSTLDDATAAFILEIMKHNGPISKRLCNKDPFSFIYLSILGHIFPNAKFIFMVRDGRAVTHSVMKRKITIYNVNNANPWDILEHWNVNSKSMYDSCLQLGSDRCIMIKYENLVLQPRKWITIISNFLGISQDKKMFFHSQNLLMQNVSVNKYERSSDQVIKPLSRTPLYEWVNDSILPQNFLLKAHTRAFMLKVLNYDISRLPPNYW